MHDPGLCPASGQKKEIAVKDITEAIEESKLWTIYLQLYSTNIKLPEFNSFKW